MEYFGIFVRYCEIVPHLQKITHYNALFWFCADTVDYTDGITCTWHASDRL